MIRFIVRLGLLIIVAVVACLVWAVWPRTANLRDFDAEEVARIEAGMWRDYYERDYKHLWLQLFNLHYRQYHFSPARSLELATAASQAAKIFQPTTNRDEAQIALPELTKYYSLLKESSGESFDPAKVAATELDWWQLRRETNAPEKYCATIADVTEKLFGVKNDHTKEAARLRARMMRYRDDRRDGKMQPSDWTHIEKNLIESYRELRRGVARTP
jgi:hypothetical protein